MTKYLLLYRAPTDAPRSRPSPEEMQHAMASADSSC
jgi:hypothetical protein